MNKIIKTDKNVYKKVVNYFSFGVCCIKRKIKIKRCEPQFYDLKVN